MPKSKSIEGGQIVDSLSQMMRSGQIGLCLGNNVTEAPRPEGNTASKAIRRLRKSRPDLHERVLKRELSPHRAMVEAGFRRPTITVELTASGVLKAS